MNLSTDSPTTEYILIDFSCSKYFSHNWTYLSEFGKFIEESGRSSSVEYWISKAADKRIGSSKQSQVFSFLLSPIYGFSRSRNFLRWTIDQFFERGIYLLDRVKWLRSIGQILMRIATAYYTQAAVRALRARYRKTDDIVLVFPSIDGLGLHFLKRCLRKNIPIKQIVLRTLQAEGRGMFSVPNLILFVEDLILNSPVLDVRVGFEVDRVGSNLKSSSKSISRILWSPIPSTKSTSWRDSGKSESVTRIGFLGAARKLKGFENVPKIISSIASSGERFEFYVQLAAEEWTGYQDILKAFRNSGIEVIFLEGGCSDELLLQTISILDFLVLPYYVEEYRFAGSGLLFHAADFGVPVISLLGVGFDWDIQEFSIGVLCDTYEEIPGLLQSLDRNTYSKSIIEYNLARNKATTELLNFGNTTR